MRKVLSIDGGGIRGIIPAIVLAEILRRTGRPTSQLFDLMAGTSTGGILALGLIKPAQGGGPEYSAKKLIELYEAEGGKIFYIPVWHRIRSAGGVAEEKYPAKGIEEVARRYFADVHLADALTEVLVTSPSSCWCRGGSAPGRSSRSASRTSPGGCWPPPACSPRPGSRAVRCWRGS